MLDLLRDDCELHRLQQHLFFPDAVQQHMHRQAMPQQDLRQLNYLELPALPDFVQYMQRINYLSDLRDQLLLLQQHQLHRQLPRWHLHCQ